MVWAGIPPVVSFVAPLTSVEEHTLGFRTWRTTVKPPAVFLAWRQVGSVVVLSAVVAMKIGLPRGLPLLLS